MGWEVITVFSLSYLLQRCQGIFGFRPDRVVGIDIGMPDDPFGIDNQGGGNRQRPTVICVVFGNVEAELPVNGDEVVGHLVFQAVAGRDFIAGVAENIHGEVLFFGNGLVIFGQLR